MSGQQPQAAPIENHEVVGPGLSTAPGDGASPPPQPQRTHAAASAASLSYSHHRNSSGDTGSNSIDSSSGRRASSNSSGSLFSIWGMARSSWSIQEEAGDEAEEDEDEDSVGDRSRGTSSASISAFLPSRMTFYQSAQDLADVAVADSRSTSNRRGHRLSAASSGKAAAWASTSSRHPHQSAAAAAVHDDHHQHHAPERASVRLAKLFTAHARPASTHPPPSAAPRRHRVAVVSPALAHFRAKLQAAVRTAIAAGLAVAISQFVWAWSQTYVWFSITLCISGTHQSLGETLAAACDFWRGAALLLPLVYLVHIVRGRAALVATGLFLAVVAIIAYPGLSDAGKRMATILLALVVLSGEGSPELAYHNVIGDLLLTLLMANVFSVVALLMPLPHAALALLEARRQLKTLRHRLGSLLRGFNHAFGLGEEVHQSVLEQLLEEAAQALKEIKALLPYLKWEMALLRLPRRAYAHLVAYLDAVEAKQLDILRGLKLSLRRIPTNNGTHREFLAYIHRPLGNVLLACVAVADAAGKQIENELLVFPWLRRRRLQRQRHQHHHHHQRQQQHQQQQQQRKSTTKHDAHSPSRRSTVAAAAGGRPHPHQHRRTATSSNSGDDLDALATIAETRLEALMREFLKARLAIFFGYKVAAPEEAVGGGEGPTHSSTPQLPAKQAALHTLITPLKEEEEEEERESAQQAEATTTTPSTADLSTLDAPIAVASSVAPSPEAAAMEHVRMPTGAGGDGGHTWVGRGSEVVTLMKRRTSGDAVFNTFTREYARLGVINFIPRNAFLMDVSLYVRSLDDLVAACSPSIPSSSATAPVKPLSWSAKAKAAVVPIFALWQHRPWRKTRAAIAEGETNSHFRGQRATAATTATTLGGQTQGSANALHAKDSHKPDAADAHTRSGWGRRLVRRLRQPVKVALAVVVASLGILLHRGPATTWAVVAVCQSLTSHSGSSFRSAYNNIQGTVLGGMAGIAALEWCGLTNPPAIMMFISFWTLVCCFSRRSAVYGETAVVAALTAPIIMLGPVSGEVGAMLRVERTVLGCLIYSLIDNLFWPKRAKLDLRRELVVSLEYFLELWTSAFGVFHGRDDIGEEGAARTQASRARLMASFAQQERFIALASDEPELWHKPFVAASYRKVVGTLTEASLFLSMLLRASAAFPRELGPEDRAMHAAIQSAVTELELATGLALEQARDAVLGLKDRSAHAHSKRNKGGGGGGALPVASAKGSNYHRRKKTQAVRPMSPTTAQAYALLRLAEQYSSLREFIDVFWQQHIEAKRAQEDTDLVSAEYMLSLSALLFSIEGLGRTLLRVGHSLRELVEREKSNAYAL